MDISDGHQDKGAVNTDMLLNDDVPAEGSQQKTQNAEGHVSSQDDAMQIDHETNIEKGAEEDMAIGGEISKSGDLDIESMLAAIHHDASPSDVRDAHNIV